jgi:hypothetical protein
MTSSFLKFIAHTQQRTTVDRTPLDKWSARRRDLYLRIHNTHRGQTSMPSAEFEPTFSAGERAQTYALDCAATGTGNMRYINDYLRASLNRALLAFSGQNLGFVVLSTTSISQYCEPDFQTNQRAGLLQVHYLSAVERVRSILIHMLWRRDVAIRQVAAAAGHDVMLVGCKYDSVVNNWRARTRA